MVIAFLVAGAAVLVQIHAVQEATPIVYQAQQGDVQILPADHPVTRALVEATEAVTKHKVSVSATVSPQPIAPQVEAPVQTTPIPTSTPVLPPIVIVIPPAATAPAPEVATTAPPIITSSVPAQEKYMPKAPEVVLKVNGQEVESITVSKGGVVKFEWVVAGESSQISFRFADSEDAGAVNEHNIEEEGHREFTMESNHTFSFQAVGKNSGLGTKKAITVNVQ